MKLPKILIFTPVYEGKDYCFEDFLEQSKKLSYPNKRHIFIDNSVGMDYYNKLKQYDIEVYHVERGNNSREALARSQNFARKIAIEEDYDYIFSLESDVFCPPDIISGLLVSCKDVISGLYFIGDRSQGVRVPCITIAEFNKTLNAYGTRLLEVEEWNDYLQKGIKQVQACGMGCCLISKKIFKENAFTYDPRFTGHSDIYFFNDMFRQRIPVFVDTDIVCDHKNSNWLEVEDR